MLYDVTKFPFWLGISLEPHVLTDDDSLFHVRTSTPNNNFKKHLMYLRKHHVSLASQKSKARKDYYLIHLLKKKIRDGSNGLFKSSWRHESPDLQWPFEPRQIASGALSLS